MTCSDPETGQLIGSYELGLLSPEEKERFEQHLLGCDTCFQEVYEMAPVAARLREGADVPEPVPFRKLLVSRIAVIGGTVAAGIVLLFALSVFLGHEPGERLRGQEGGEILVFAPIGEVAVPRKLEWEPVPGATSYEVTLHGPGGERLWTDVVEAPPAALPESVLDLLAPGESYAWQVVASSPTGERWTSGPVRVTIRD